MSATICLAACYQTYHGPSSQKKLNKRSPHGVMNLCSINHEKSHHVLQRSIANKLSFARFLRIRMRLVALFPCVEVLQRRIIIVIRNLGANYFVPSSSSSPSTARQSAAANQRPSAAGDNVWHTAVCRCVHYFLPSLDGVMNVFVLAQHQTPFTSVPRRRRSLCFG